MTDMVGARVVGCTRVWGGTGSGADPSGSPWYGSGWVLAGVLVLFWLFGCVLLLFWLFCCVFWLFGCGFALFWLFGCGFALFWLFSLPGGLFSLPGGLFSLPGWLFGHLGLPGWLFGHLGLPGWPSWPTILGLSPRRFRRTVDLVSLRLWVRPLSKTPIHLEMT